MEQTLLLIKPDGVKRHLTGEVLARVERKGYVMTDLKMVTATEELLSEHYAEHREKSFFPDLTDLHDVRPDRRGYRRRRPRHRRYSLLVRLYRTGR